LWGSNGPQTSVGGKFLRSENCSLRLRSAAGQHSISGNESEVTKGISRRHGHFAQEQLFPNLFAEAFSS